MLQISSLFLRRRYPYTETSDQTQKIFFFHLWIVVNGRSYLLSPSSPLIHPSPHKILYTLHIHSQSTKIRGSQCCRPLTPLPYTKNTISYYFLSPFSWVFFLSISSRHRPPACCFSYHQHGGAGGSAATEGTMVCLKHSTPQTNERSLSWQQEGSRMKEELRDGCYCDEWWLLQLGRGTWGQIWLGKGCENLFLEVLSRHYHHTHTHTIELARFYSMIDFVNKQYGYHHMYSVLIRPGKQTAD